MKKRPTRRDSEDNGFAQWGGYMEAKKTKLLHQFNTATMKEVAKLSNIFEGIAIHVNGRTNPPDEDLKLLMAAHGGQFHTYQTSKTTHIVASNLPNVKIKHLGNTPIVKPSWVTDSINSERLLDYTKYLLYSNQSKTQPKLNFPTTNNEPETPRQQTRTASDPGFLSEFYNHSRLHLISTLGAEFKQLVRQFREKSNGDFPGLKSLATKPIPTSSTPPKVIMHIDMDCFFVSVGLRKRPDLKGQPVAVTHAKAGQHVPENGENRAAELNLWRQRLGEGISRLEGIDENASMSEIASCSYEARKRGVKNGMFLGTALKLCPELKTIPYDFEDYRQVSHTLYNTIASYTLDIEAVSCDEMYVDCSKILHSSGLTVMDWAAHIRSEITRLTGCPCSAGFGANRLQARLATRKAKPDGQFYLQEEEVEEYMKEIPVKDLPGVGSMTLGKLRKLGVESCGDLQQIPLTVLRTELGPKASETLCDQSRGIDRKPLNFDHERKSVSAEVNYGIRFKTQDEAVNFLKSLSEEVHGRLTDVGMRARCLTLKLLVRAADAPTETAKFMGHGVCDSLTKSTTSGALIDSSEAIFREVTNLFEKLSVPCHELRGVGIQLTKLEKIPPVNTALANFLKAGPAKTNEATVSEPQAVRAASVQAVKTKLPRNETSEKSGRGRGRSRGRGRGGAKGSPKQYNDLSKYMQIPQAAKVPILRNASIDLNVLNELPEDLRQEIIREYQLQTSVVKEKAATETETNFSDINSLNTCGSTMRSPFKNLSYEQLKDSIRHWCASEKEPKPHDVQMLSNYFRELAVDRKIEMLHSVLNFLHRIFEDQECQRWHKSYFEIVNGAQEGMVARYGSTLRVYRNFSCCTNN